MEDQKHVRVALISVLDTLDLMAELVNRVGQRDYSNGVRHIKENTQKIRDLLAQQGDPQPNSYE